MLQNKIMCWKKYVNVYISDSPLFVTVPALSLSLDSFTFSLHSP